MLKQLLIYAFLLIYCALSAQPQYSFQLLAKASYAGHDIAMDDMGNIFVADGAKLTKLDAQAHYLARFYPPFQGAISSIDVDNPRRLLLWYQKYGYMVFLDQHLAMQNAVDPAEASYTDTPLDMESLGKYDVLLACLDSYKGFWTYNSQMQDLCWYESENELSFCADTPIEVEGMTANSVLMSDDYLYLNFPEKGIVVFDADAHFVKLLPLKGIQRFYVYQQVLYYVNDNSLISVQVDTEEMNYHLLPIQSFVAWAMQMETQPMRIAFLLQDGVSVYGIENINNSKKH